MSWTSVEDRLPNDHEIVLVFRANTMQDTCLFISKDRVFYNSARQQYNNGEITHWMPLPEPPNK